MAFHFVFSTLSDIAFIACFLIVQIAIADSIGVGAAAKTVLIVLSVMRAVFDIIENSILLYLIGKYAHINETGEKEILDDTSNETGDILERFVFNEDSHFTKIKFNGNTSEGIYHKAIDEDYAEYYGENVRPVFLCGNALEFIENPYPYEKGEIELAGYDSGNDELLIHPDIYKRTVEPAAIRFTRAS